LDNASGYLDGMFRRSARCTHPSSDARSALTAAIKHLAQRSGVQLSEPGGPMHLLSDLRDEADRWLVLFVRDAIEGGASWADVGGWLGVSRQAAHERYSAVILDMARRATQDDQRA
jgi:hypothetical protein